MSVYAEATEASLIHQALQGDRNAFAELVRRTYPEVLQVVYHMCGDIHLAEDAVQEAFIRAWLKLETYRPVTPLRNWLYRIAINLVWDTLRRERTHETWDVADMKDPQIDLEAQLIHKEEQVAVRNAILSLPPASRAALVLREYGHLSYREIAEALDIPLGTVMSRLNEARQQLRKRLESYYSPMEVKNDE